jgi:hypothetical protein
MATVIGPLVGHSKVWQTVSRQIEPPAVKFVTVKQRVFAPGNGCAVKFGPLAILFHS